MENNARGGTDAMRHDTALSMLKSDSNEQPIKCFCDIEILNREITDGFKCGNVLEIFSDTQTAKTLFLMKLACVFCLPGFIVNRSETTKGRVDIFHFKGDDEPQVEMLYFDNSRGFRHQVFVEFLEKFVYYIICSKLGTEDIEEVEIHRIFGGHQNYQEFIAGCAGKIHLKRCRNVFDLWYSLELFDITKSKTRVIMLDSFNTFRNTQTEKTWKKAILKLRNIAEKQYCSLIFTRTHRWKKRGKEGYVQEDDILYSPFKMVQILDRDSEYNEIWNNCVDYRRLKRKNQNYFLYKFSEDSKLMISFEKEMS